MTASHRGTLASIYRHPVKGLTAEPLRSVRLEAGRCFPCDRLYAVEDGPSGFDPASPRHISKMRFAVLAKVPEVAKVRARYDEAAGELRAEAPGEAPFRGVMTSETGRQAFAGWLQHYLRDQARGPLRVLEAPGDHRFMDDLAGFVSLINLASLRALEARVGRPLDPLRFRANLYVDGWPAWIENDYIGGTLAAGALRAAVVKPTGRCRAIHVDPQSGAEDIDLVSQLFNHFGHTVMGVYLAVQSPGSLELGDTVELTP